MTMGDIRILCGKSVPSLRRITLVIPMLFILSNCAHVPTPMPGDTPVYAYLPGVRAMIGKTDVAWVIEVQDKDEVQAVPFHWNMKGKLVWWERPGNTAALTRFLLLAPGVTEPICKTEWMTSEFTSTICKFNPKNYLATPLFVEIDYFMHGDIPEGQLPEEDPGPNGKPYRVEGRMYYLSNPISSKFPVVPVVI